MPILPAEPDLYPPELWNIFSSDWGAERRWWCLHTKPRMEKAVSRELRQYRVPFYLPQVTQEARTPQGRKIRSVLPLFPSYVFLFGDDDERLVALRGNRLVRVLEVVDQQRLGLDLTQIHRMLASGLTVLPEPTMPVGAQVRIMSGPLTGVVGRVIRRGKSDQFVAVVHFLGCGATVNLEDWQVERISDEEETA